MDIVFLSEQFSVSAQLAPAHVAALAEHGVEVLVCNRPDREDPGQEDYETLAQQAQALGLETADLPMNDGSDIRPEHVQSLKTLIDSGKRIHAYCRSGNRSSLLWQAASASA